MDIWRQKAARAENLIPVGDRVLVTTGTYEPTWVLRDDTGKELASRQGTVVRLDGANALSFSGTLSTTATNLSVAGVGARGGVVTELGPLREARGSTCSWSVTAVICQAGLDFVLWRFTEQ